MKVISSIENIIISSIAKLIREKPFYGHILQQIEKIYVEKYDPVFPTVSIAKFKEDLVFKLFINKKYIEKVWDECDTKDLSFKKMIGILEHEILHICFGHLSMEFKDKERSAIAFDLSVNSWIDNDELPNGVVFPEQFKLIPKQTAVWYYENLPEQMSWGIDGETVEKIMMQHSNWEDMKNDSIAQEILKDIINKSKEFCSQNYGNIPGDLISIIDKTLQKKKPKIRWDRVLRLFCSSLVEGGLDYTKKRISKRYKTRPGTRIGDVLNLCVGIDTSASISDEQLAYFFNEIRHIWKNGAKITIFECDTRISDEYLFEGNFTGKVSGRGGTCLDPVLENAEKRRFDGLVYFTDFEAPQVCRKYFINMLWILTKEMDKSRYPCIQGKVAVLNI